MRKSLLTLSLALMLGGAAVAVAATQTNMADTQKPVLLAQASPQPFNRPVAPPEGRSMRRAAPSAETVAARRQAMCEDRHDRLAGQLAYLEARLDLNPTQRATFTRWRDVRLTAARRQADTCAAQPGPAGRGAAAAGTRPSPVERMAREEQRLRARLADLTAERPALEALYNSLSSEQQQKFTPAGGGRGMGRGGMRPRMMTRNRLGMRGPGGRGPGGSGIGRSMGPGMMPPPGGPGAPPPAQ